MSTDLLRDERPLHEIVFAADLGDTERDLVLRRSKIKTDIYAAEAGIRSRREAIDAEVKRAGEAGETPNKDLIAQNTEEAAKFEEDLTGLRALLASLDEKIEPYVTHRAGVAEDVRRMLAEVEIATASDIIDAGCTGLFGKFSSVEAARKVRDNMGGSGVGLPCYVSNDRFCLVHQTIGGLQDQQEARHTQYIGAMSRDLTAVERGYRDTVEHARRKRGPHRMADAHDLLQQEEERRRKGSNGASTDMEGMASQSPPEPRDMTELFKCTEHGELMWSCRFCVAQAIVEGGLEPSFLVLPLEATQLVLNNFRAGQEVQIELDALSEAMADGAQVYARVARFRRKLARER